MNLRASPYVTTLDLLKTWAVLLMVLDHAGFFFLAGIGGDISEWCRILGRLSVPVWFFLIGYARTRDVSRVLIVSAAFLLVMHMVYGWFIFPLNVLFSIIVIRIVLNPVMRFMYQSRGYFWLTLFGLFIALIPSLFWMEYGTLGLLIALYGAAIRRDQDVQQGACLPFGNLQERTGQTPMDLKVLYIAALIMFYAATLYLFHFDRMQMAVMIIACALVLHVLSRLDVREVRGRFSPLVSSTLRWTGRHTLMIYVVHLTCFHIISWGVSAGSLPHRFGQWEWTIVEAYAAKHKGLSTED